MAIASSTSSRRQCSSHGAGQTRPRTDGNGIVRLKMRVDSRQFASAFCLQEARDVDVAGALVLAGRQAVGVVVAEDQLEVRRAQAADHLGLGRRPSCRPRRPASSRSAGAPRPRPRRRTSGRRRSRAASARSRASGSRCRCRGRPRGSSGPRGPRRRRPSTSIRMRGVACGRCGAWVVSRRSGSVSAAAAGGARDQVGHRGRASLRRRRRPPRPRVADAGWAGAARCGRPAPRGSIASRW